MINAVTYDPTLLERNINSWGIIGVYGYDIETMAGQLNGNSQMS
jgi:hypothetical protein